MTFATLLLVPLTAGFHPTSAACPAQGCTPAAPCGPMLPGMPTGPCQPLGPPAPLLAMKLIAPAGVRVTMFPGSPLAQVYAAAPLVGLRPGYVYRFEFAGLPGRADTRLYPEIEVRGTLVPRAGMNYMEYFAGVYFSEAELERAAAGALITKVIYLEDPEKAAPQQSTADRPVELGDPTEREALTAAKENGRIVAVVRLGNRQPGEEELQAVSVAGTVLLPGEQHLAQPTCPPTLGWQGVPLYDPILGPKPTPEECFTDGGDKLPRMAIRDSGLLGGLNPTDTAAEYSVGPKRKVATSNTVCICVPRFAVRRVEAGIGGIQTAVRSEVGAQRVASQAVQLRTPPQILLTREKPVAAVATQRPQVQIGRQNTFVLANSIGTKAIYTHAAAHVVKGAVEPDETTNNEEFTLTKDVDPKAGVKIGDEVTFTLTYKNSTGLPITDLVVSDSLSGRLDYVPGTAQSDRAINTTTTPNDAGSVIVRFEVPGTLQPGQGGTIRFRAKVR